MLVAAVVVTPIAGWAVVPALTDPVAILAGIGVGISSSVIPYIADQLAMRELPRATYALMVSLLPATATVIGVIVLSQLPSALELLGVALGDHGRRATPGRRAASRRRPRAGSAGTRRGLTAPCVRCPISSSSRIEKPAARTASPSASSVTWLSVRNSASMYSAHSSPWRSLARTRPRSPRRSAAGGGTARGTSPTGASRGASGRRATAGGRARRRAARSGASRAAAPAGRARARTPTTSRPRRRTRRERRAARARRLGTTAAAAARRSPRSCPPASEDDRPASG